MAARRNLYGPRSNQDLVDLLRAQPLAWVVSGAAENFGATLLPLLPVVSQAGELTGLMGHFAKSNPHMAALRADPRAAILILGPHGYISPSWLDDRTRAPTWNYASAQCLVDIEFHDDPAALGPHLQELVEFMEAGRPRPWSISEMGPRYELLAGMIVCFTAHVQELQEKYKLGQDEPRQVFADIRTGLEANGETELLGWMSRFNPKR